MERIQKSSTKFIKREKTDRVKPVMNRFGVSYEAGEIVLKNKKTNKL